MNNSKLDNIIKNNQNITLDNNIKYYLKLLESIIPEKSDPLKLTVRIRKDE